MTGRIQAATSTDETAFGNEFNLEDGGDAATAAVDDDASYTDVLTWPYGAFLLICRWSHEYRVADEFANSILDAYSGRLYSDREGVDVKTLESVFHGLGPSKAVPDTAFMRVTIRVMMDVVPLAMKPVAWYIMRPKPFLILLMVSLSLRLPLTNDVPCSRCIGRTNEMMRSMRSEGYTGIRSRVPILESNEND